MRLIDADKLSEAIHENVIAMYEESAAAKEDCLREIEEAPTVDAVVVTRCKDCKHLCVWNRKDIYAFCPKTNIVFLPFEQDTRTFFCGCGERKENDHEKV